MRICGTRPRCWSSNQRRLCPQTQYSTLAKNATLPRQFLRPVSFLVHLSGLTMGSIMIPVIGARMMSSRKLSEEKSEESDSDGSISRPLALPPPQPSPMQLRRLSSILRNQITSVRQGVDALFTLRQLHMLKRPAPPSLPALPYIELPAPEIVLLQEKWLWRLPASAAIHAILRNREERLMDTAVELARNALRWDRLIWEALLVQAGSRMKEDKFGFRKSDGRELPAVKLVTTLPTPITPTDISDTSIILNSPLIATSSLSSKTLELLFLVLAQTPNRSPETTIAVLHLAFSMLHLALPLSNRMYWHTFKICLEIKREDLAALVWERWYEHASKTMQGELQVKRAFEKLRKILRPHRTSFQFTPTTRTLSAVTHLSRMLDAANSTTQSSPILIADLVQLLSNFPPPWRPAPIKKEQRVLSTKLGRVEVHSQVASLVKKVLMRMIENIVGKKIISTQAGYSLDLILPLPPSTNRARATYAVTTIHTSLLKFSLEILKSHPIAIELLNQIPEKVLHNSAQIHNILLANAALALKPIPTNNNSLPIPENDYTMPTTILFLTRISRFVDLDRIVFTLLPELDLKTFSTDSEVLARTVIPPPAGRSPYLYTTLLDALRKAGRTGLAERVFRSARWASQLSQVQGSAGERGEKSWKLPPAIFTIMLQLYAAEAKKKTPVTNEFTTSAIAPNENRNVIGWGRHALRVLYIERNKEALREKLDSTVEVRGRRSGRSLEIPATPRSEAAAIVAKWELEDGSNETEGKSFKLALRSPFSRTALLALFPDRQSARKRKVWRRIRARNALARVEAELKGI